MARAQRTLPCRVEQRADDVDAVGAAREGQEQGDRRVRHVHGIRAAHCDARRVHGIVHREVRGVDAARVERPEL